MKCRFLALSCAYEILEGIDINALCYVDDIDTCLQPILKAVNKLERMGCRAIAAECGYFCYFQKQLAAALGVPAFMSSLLQVPWAQQLIGPTRKVAIVTSDAYLLANHDIGSIVLECTGYPPFARAIQRAVDLPVYSWGTLLDYAWSVVAHRDYYGHV